MLKNNKREKGITLVALIITIIVLIILAAVTIFAFTESGLLQTARKGAENYAGEQIREEEMMKNIAEKAESIVDNIRDIQEGIMTGPKIEFSANTDKYTFETVEIIVTATAPKGETITKIEQVEGNEAILKEGNTYIVNKNGEYSFKVTTSGNKTYIATKIIENILQAPEIVVNNVTETSLTISIETVYPENAAVKYEYYVDGIKKCDKTTDKEYNASGLHSSPDHTVKVIAYISDDNYKEFEKKAFIDLKNITNLSGKTIDESKVEYIYNVGTVNEDFGEVKLIDNLENNSIAEFKPNYIVCQTSSRCSRHNAKIGTTNSIDLSKYESVYAVIKSLDYKEGYFGMCIFSGNSEDSNRGYMNIQKANAYSSFENNKLCIISCDITETGQGYPAVHYTYDKFLVYQIFLVKK